MRSTSRIAVVARVDESRAHLVKYLIGAGYEVFACEELSIPNAFAAVVTIDGQEPPVECLRSCVRSWLEVGTLWVMVITFMPERWRALSLAHEGRLMALAAPARGQEIVHALRTRESRAPGIA